VITTAHRLDGIDRTSLRPRVGDDGSPSGAEMRFGRTIASRLDGSAMGSDIAERLRIARQQAVHLARVRRLALQPAQATTRHGDGTLAATAWWMRLGTMLPAVALVAGLVGIQEWHEQTQIAAAAEIDAALLADDVPIDAYADAGFIEFLKEARP
jgi:hypothetical protein